ncbi:unnamed protein product [Closterium sp. Naga37s-1]|nr:unnamed protein product [Closterium sp. Naga37s-1]
MVAESSPPTEDLPHSFDSLALSSSALIRSVRSENATGGDAGRGSGEGPGVPVEVLSSVLKMMPSLDDLATAARVNRAWRISALSPSQLRACAIDDDCPTAPSAHSRVLAHSRAPMPPKPPPPELWLNPTAFSPFLHLRTPESLHRARNTISANPLRASAAAGDPGNTSLSSRTSGAAPATPEAAITSRRADGAEGRNWGGGGAWSSPRTPSPVAAREGELIAFEDEVTQAVNHGRRVLRACPHLQALRVQHVCMGATFNGSPPPFHGLLSPTSPYHLPFSTSPSPSPETNQRATSPSPVASSPPCGSPPFPPCAFPSSPCASPSCASSPCATSSPQTALSRRRPSSSTLPTGSSPLPARGLAGIGALCPAIKTLTLTLQQAMTALASAGPAPLTALSLSPCALTPASFHTLASAFPRLMVALLPACTVTLPPCTCHTATMPVTLPASILPSHVHHAPAFHPPRVIPLPSPSSFHPLPDTPPAMPVPSGAGPAGAPQRAHAPRPRPATPGTNSAPTAPPHACLAFT